MSKLRISKKEFVEWLKSFKPYEYPTRRILWGECPLTCFYRYKNKDNNFKCLFSTGGAIFTNDHEGKVHSVPKWIKHFIREVDCLSNGLKWTNVTAKEMLDILK